MKPLDALHNWLQIKVVYEARPDDRPAKETLGFFTRILSEDHGIEVLEVTRDETMYRVLFLQEGKRKQQMFDRESVEYLLRSIEAEPKYGQ